jgi:CRP/FNR family cyclic AMP-dependent transcriptional regulator
MSLKLLPLLADARADPEISIPPSQRTFLTNHPIFASLDRDELIEILHTMQHGSLEAGELLFNEGDPGDAVYIIEDGTIEIYLASDDKAEVPVETHGTGAILGELAFLEGTTRSASARASERTSLFSINRPAFEALRLRMCPSAYKLIRTMTSTLCHRIRRIDNYIAQLLTVTTPTTTSADELDAGRPLP